MPNIYQRIKDRRIELGMTVDDLAKKMGYKDRSSISKIENGKADIPQSKVMAFAKALETTTAYLMGIDEEKTPDFRISYGEIELIKKYRDLDDHGKRLIDTILVSEYERCHPAEKIVSTPEPIEEIPPYPIAAMGGIPEGAKNEVYRKFREMEKRLKEDRKKYHPSILDDYDEEDE